jgi:hypothetical protein
MTTHRFNVSEYYRMGKMGLLNQRTELIDGTIIDLEPIGPGHADIGDTLADHSLPGGKQRTGRESSLKLQNQSIDT